MTFLNQVQGLTGLTISASGTNPTRDELSQFLRDGLIEVINRLIEINPAEAVKFGASTHDANDSGITITGKILSVVREHDSQTILRPCTLIDAADRYEANNVDSLKYRSKYNPGYYILDKKIHTAPISAGSDNDSIVTQVTYDTGLTHDDSESGIENFPREYAYLVPLYAAIKSLEAKMSEYTIDEEDAELAQSIGMNIAVLQKQYDTFFGLKAPPKKQQQQQQQAGAR